MQQRGGQKERVMIVLWSEFLVLWLDRTRRRALPLLLATLLLLIPSLPARSDCSCEMSGEGHQQMAHHHEGEDCDHDESEEHAHSAAIEQSSFVGSQNGSHAHLVTLSQRAVSRGVTTCCSCSTAPAPAAVVAATAPSNVHADNHTLLYVRVSALSAYSFDALAGLFGRAGPPAQSKPKHLFLASLSGRAPPISL